MVAFLSSMPVTVAVTLRYETIPITIDKIRRDLHDLHAKVDRKIFGRDFHLSATRTTYWGVIEMLDTNPHVHLGWHFPDARDANVLNEFLSGGLWQRRYAVGGTFDVQQHRSGWAAYCCKALPNSDHVILSLGCVTPRVGCSPLHATHDIEVISREPRKSRDDLEIAESIQSSIFFNIKVLQWIING